MTGAAIVRWQARDAIVLAVHGAFDGSAAWALRLAMEESPAERFVIDLRHSVEACDFAASILAQFARLRRRDKRIAFRPGSPEHARLLTGHGLDLVGDGEPLEPVLPPADPWSAGPPAAA
jgi:anti-anti-sigma regulatory factor